MINKDTEIKVNSEEKVEEGKTIKKNENLNLEEKANKEETEIINNLKKEDEKGKTEDKIIKENKEKERKKEDNEEEKPIEKNQKYIIRKNAVIFFDKLCYENAIKNLTEKCNDLDEIKGTLEEGYNDLYDDIISNISNEFYYLFEITFFCIYLTVIEIYNEKQKEINDKEEMEKEEEEEEEENESFEKNIKEGKINKNDEEKNNIEVNNNEKSNEEENKEEVNIEEESKEKIKKEGLNLEKNIKGLQNKDEYKEGEKKEIKEEVKNLEKLDKEESNKEKENKVEFKKEDLKEEEINKKGENREEEVNKEINKEEYKVMHKKQKEENNAENNIIKEKIKNVNEDKRTKKERIGEIMKYIFSFITTYEKFSLYLNFIDEEGFRTYIKSKYDELFPKLPKDILYDNNYKSIEDLRKYLLENKKFSYFDDSKDKIMEIIRKEVIFVEDEEINKNCGNIDNINKKFLFNTFNENNNFYKGLKKERVMKFFEEIEYNEKIDTNQKNKILKEYIDNYLSIIG